MKATAIKTTKAAITLASLCPAIAGECCKQVGVGSRCSRTIAAACWFGDFVTPGVPAVSGLVIMAAHLRDARCGIRAAKAIGRKLKG